MAKSNPLEVLIYKGDSKRAAVICEAMVAGITKCKDRVLKVVPASSYKHGAVKGDVAVFYGLKDTLLQIYKDYTLAGKKTVLIDLGYWGRHDGGRLSGYHRVVANHLHPNYYYQMISHPPDRFLRFNVKLKPQSKEGEFVLLAGMSAKSAWVFGLEPNEFELRMIKEIKKHTDRPILYRPKPSWDGATPLPGTVYSPPDESIDAALGRSSVVVTHHSNVAIDAISAGKACIVPGHGVGVAVSSPFDKIDDPYFPHEAKRHQWLCDIAYTQWNVKEIQEGKPWKHLKHEGLL